MCGQYLPPCRSSLQFSGALFMYACLTADDIIFFNQLTYTDYLPVIPGETATSPVVTVEGRTVVVNAVEVVAGCFSTVKLNVEHGQKSEDGSVHGLHNTNNLTHNGFLHVLHQSVPPID